MVLAFTLQKRELKTFVYGRFKMSVLPKESKVQLCLIKVDENEEKCKICAKDVAAKDWNTANLIWRKS